MHRRLLPREAPSRTGSAQSASVDVAPVRPTPSASVSGHGAAAKMRSRSRVLYSAPHSRKLKGRQVTVRWATPRARQTAGPKRWPHDRQSDRHGTSRQAVCWALWPWHEGRRRGSAAGGGQKNMETLVRARGFRGKRAGVGLWKRAERHRRAVRWALTVALALVLGCEEGDSPAGDRAGTCAATRNGRRSGKRAVRDSAA